MLRVSSPLDVARIRADFPILTRQVNGHPLVYLDNAASSHKPRRVIDALVHFYTHTNANVHRGVHTLSVEATDAYEEARERVGRFVGSDDPNELVFVRNATEGLNLVAACWGRANLKPGDEILATLLEHHSNLVPWQRVAQDTGARIRLVPLKDDATIDLDAFRSMLSPRTKVVAVAHASNVLGTINPLPEIAEQAHQYSAIVVVDGAQSVPHVPTDVHELGIDFLAFSGHKMLAPMGIGGLWGRRELLEAMPPFLGGGGMIREVFEDRATWAPLPEKFDAGTPSVADSIAFGTAVDYLDELGMANVRAHEIDRAPVQLAGRLGVRSARCARSDGRRLVQPGRRPSARCGHDPGRGGRGGARRTPLLPAVAPLVGRRGDAARQLLRLQHDRRGRCARRRAADGAEGVPAQERLSLPSILSSE